MGFGLCLIPGLCLDCGIVAPGGRLLDQTREFGDFGAWICPSRCWGGSDVSWPVLTDTDTGLAPGFSPAGNFGMRVRAGRWHHQVTQVLPPPCPDRICHRGVNPGSEPSAPAPNPGMEPLAPAALLALLVLALGHPDPALDRHWELWKKSYGKEYQPQVGTARGGSWGCARGVLGISQDFPGLSWWGNHRLKKIRRRFHKG